jgi:hypothetical protein
VPRRSTLALDGMNPYGMIIAVVCLATIVTSVNASEPEPSADALFAIVSAARVSADSERIVDPGAFARENLEDTLRSIDAAAGRAHSDNLDWTRDALLVGLGALNTFDAVYSIKRSETKTDPVALQMQVTNCGTPSVLTIGFRMEEGLWRMHSFHFDWTKSATSWYRDGLMPVESWKHVRARDRSRYFNESNLGKVLELKLPPTNDKCQ